MRKGERKTHCKRGHVRNKRNWYTPPSGKGGGCRVRYFDIAMDMRMSKKSIGDYGHQALFRLGLLR